MVTILSLSCQFMTNQKVMDMCTKYKDPLEACRQIQATSYNLWMKNDRRTDDITMIAIYIDEVKSPGASSAPIKPASIKPALLQSAVAHPGAGFIGTDKSNPVEKKPLPPDFNIEELIDCMKETCKATFGGVSVRYAHLSQRGYYPDGKAAAVCSALSFQPGVSQLSHSLFKSTLLQILTRITRILIR